MLKSKVKLNISLVLIVIKLVIVADIADKIIKQCYRDKNGAEVEALLRFSVISELFKSFKDYQNNLCTLNQPLLTHFEFTLLTVDSQLHLRIREICQVREGKGHGCHSVFYRPLN